MIKTAIYKREENGIEYLIFQAPNYSYLNKYNLGENIVPKNFIKNDNIKFIIIGTQLYEVYYFYKGVEHNMYGPSFERYLFEESLNTYSKIARDYHICGTRYSKDDWKKESKQYLRQKKLIKINNCN